MRLIRTTDAQAAAERAADLVADAMRGAAAARGIAVIAVSGGETPWRMLERLATLDVPWQRAHFAQVDERIAPRGDARRNLARLEEILVTHGPLPHDHLLRMPVEATDLRAAAAEYQQRLEALAGRPFVLDLVQLGLGMDGHTASLLPGDPALDVTDADVALSQPYQALRRMTLTLPALDRARQRVWLVTGAAKAPRLAELLQGRAATDTPALRVRREGAIVLADEPALAP